MALRALSNAEHNGLLKKISERPFPEERALELERQLNKFYGEYQAMIANLAVVIAGYRQVAAAIQARQPQVKEEPQGA